MNGQITLYDLMNETEKEKHAPKTSTDWKWNYSDYPKQTNGIKVFSCFAGGGGSTMGYKLAGCEVVGDVEIDPKMNELYVINHKPKYNFLMDLREFNKLNNIPGEIINIDILDGSPPCTTFSTYGKREETWGKMKKFREGQKEQTLDDLSFVFIETVRKIKPKVVIMENVEGILLGNALGYSQKIYKELGNAGYTLRHWVLKAEYMGVPQKRHRVFFIAFRNDLDVDIKEIDMTFNYEPIIYKTIKSGKGEPLAHNTKDYQMLKLAMTNETSIADVYERLGEKRRRYSAKICWENDVLSTIVAKLFHYRPEEGERISTDDVIHAQTFPEDYNFIDNKNGRLIEYVCGMSVPPLMIKRIVERLIDQGVFDYKRGDKKGGNR